MDVFTRRIIGFGIERAYVDGISVCRMFNHAVARKPLPSHLGTDHDPLFRFQRWLANLRVLEIDRDQVGSIRSGLASLRRTVDRNYPTRVHRSRLFLERRGSSAEAA
jgi:hypothetical protein